VFSFHIPSFTMPKPLQRTLSCANINDENHPPAPDLPLKSLCPAHQVSEMSALTPLPNENHDPRTNPLRSQTGSFHGMSLLNSLSAAPTPTRSSTQRTATIRHKCFSLDCRQVATVHSGLCVLMATMSTPRRSSLLGPRQYLLPGRPIFPPSIHEPNLYRRVLKNARNRRGAETRVLRG
jgi:hypothetical protein